MCGTLSKEETLGAFMSGGSARRWALTRLNVIWVGDKDDVDGYVGQRQVDSDGLIAQQGGGQSEQSPKRAQQRGNEKAVELHSDD